MILITGASGNNGTEIVKLLSEQGVLSAPAVKEVTGHPARSFEGFARDYKEVLHD